MFNRTAAALAAAAAATLLVAGTATAGPRDPAVKPSAKSAGATAGQPAAPKSAATRYCVDQRFTGSLIVRKECKTRAQWIKQTGVDPLKVN